MSNLNELEYIEGEIWANIYLSDQVVRIDPVTGKVTGVIDLKGILLYRCANHHRRTKRIAYDPKTKSIWITGKYWPRVYKISLK